MIKEDNENFESSTKCWICDNSFVESNVKVRDHCCVTGKYRGASHVDCNIKVSWKYKSPAVFHNLKKYDAHLIMQVFGKFNFKINVIPIGSEKYIIISLDNRLVFIDNLQFLGSWMIVLSQEFGSEGFLPMNTCVILKGLMKNCLKKTSYIVH